MAKKDWKTKPKTKSCPTSSILMKVRGLTAWPSLIANTKNKEKGKYKDRYKHKDKGKSLT